MAQCSNGIRVATAMGHQAFLKVTNIPVPSGDFMQIQGKNGYSSSPLLVGSKVIPNIEIDFPKLFCEMFIFLERIIAPTLSPQLP